MTTGPWREILSSSRARKHHQCTQRSTGGLAPPSWAMFEAQLATVRREVSEIETTRNYAREQFDAGLTSQIEYLDAERRWLEAKRSAITLQKRP